MTETLLERRRRLLGGAPMFYSDPVHIVRGEGIWLYDDEGRRYMDCYNNVPCVGHCHPHVVAAMHEQAATLNTHSRYASEVVLDYAERLLDLHAQPLSMLQMTCTGTEAIELALRMARTATGGHGIICSNATYHGNSTEIIRMTTGPFEPDFRRVAFPDPYRPVQDGLDPSALTELYLQQIASAIEGFAADDVPLAGMLFCSLFCNEGLPDILPEFMPRAAQMVRDAGGVVILDEVQAGFCRPGRWWGYELAGCEPDIVAMGKPMGAGYPTGGVALRGEIGEAFYAKSSYFNTMAQTALQATVANAVLDVIEAESLLSSVASVGEYLKEELSHLMQRHERIGDVRGHGLFVGIDWVSDREARTPDARGAAGIAERLRQDGYLLSNAGRHRNVLKIRPPLVFQREHADELVHAVDAALNAA